MKKIIQMLALLCMSLLLGGCKLSVLEPKGMIAAQEIKITLISAALMLLVVIPVIVMTLVFSWRYRENNIKATYAPDWAHSYILEIIWWSIPCVIIAILGTITWYSSHSLDPFRSLTQTSKYRPLTIQVIAMEWKWLFIYPEQNIATVNYLQFPVGVPIRFEITSEGPMNSFLIPQLAGQIYAMAGMQSKLHLIADEIGDYQGFSSNFSGKGFSGMKFVAHVTTQQDFEKWVTAVRQSPFVLDKNKYDQLVIPSENNPAVYYAAVNKYLFNISVMKSMMPAKEVEALCKERSWI